MSQKLFFTADTHFGHKSCVKFEREAGQLPAGMQDVEDRDWLIINAWNKVVGENDIVWHLGDFAYRNEYTIETYINRLNGKIHFLKGNHDDKGAWRHPELFESMQEAKYLKWNGTRMYLHHYACEVWRSSHHGTLHLHGHSHGDLPARGKRMDVGIMCHGYKPVEFSEIVKALSYEDVTHHHVERV